jgi:hypothetical protein
LLLTVFLSTIPTGSSSLAFCLDEQESHIVGQNLYLLDCHSTDEASRIISDEHFSALTDKREKDCIDVSLTNAHILNRPSRIKLPVSSKVVHFYALPNGIVGYQQHIVDNSLVVFSQPLFTQPQINAPRTVVLLI